MSRSFHGRFAVLLAVTLTLAACSGDSDDTATSKSTAASAAAPATSAPSAASSDAAAPTAGASSSDPGALAGASSADSSVAAGTAVCDKAASDKAVADIKAAVGGPPMITKVEISTGCLEAQLSTSLPADGFDAALKLCDKAATLAYPLGVLGVSVTSADDKLLATGIRGDVGCKGE